ncbi:probable ATP-dependent RNA helicase Dbp73D [Prorops nasuta]|uniref:probable ATP-dependent RNA helicase Dbp73D n=1 Tax=Prorops nasuta TaxID=863751 RepID=UPI0034CFD695
MSLFVINRYEGDEVTADSEKNNVSSHLTDLLKRIEDRKLERAKAADKNDEEPINKKAKKDNQDNLIVDSFECLNKNIIEEARTVNGDTSERRSTKKRKKKHVQIDAENGEDDEVIVNELENLEIEKQQDENKITDACNNFMILGSKSKKKVKEVKRSLPDWLAHPEIISAELDSGPNIEEFNKKLSFNLIEILKNNGITHLFPVQAKTISWLLKCNDDRISGLWPRDTCISAPTGSGKTLAYVLPIVQQLQSRLVPKLRCLIVLPVQELAMQVYKVMMVYTAQTSLKVALLSGASSFEQEQNSIIKKNAKGNYLSLVDIVIATPGRFVDHVLKTPGFNLDALRFLVIDEADRVIDWLQYLPAPHRRAPLLTLEELHSCKTPPAQKLLLSATLSQDPEKLSRLGLFHPILFTSVMISDKDEDVDLDKEVGNSFIGRYTSPEELKELAVECTAQYKPVALYQILTKSGTVPKSLVFTNSGEAAHRLALLMQSLLSEKNIVVGEISAHLTSKQREDVLRKFASGEIYVLVSSDALARGLDIIDIEVVVSYDLPKHIKGYIHRAGRTGRAGKTGTAISVLTSNQVGIFRHMLSNAQRKVPEIEKLDLECIADSINYQTYVEELKSLLEQEKTKTLQTAKAAKRRNPKLIGK